MAKRVISSVTSFAVTQLLIFSLCCCSQTRAETSTHELLKGFKAQPNEKESFFQALLTDSLGNYSLGFLRVEKTQLALAVIHVHSSETIWTANTGRLARWSDPTELFFNGSLILTDTDSGVFWSTRTRGDRVWLSDTSDLQIQELGGAHTVLWQSFDFPSDTLVENQTFTSKMSLVSSNGLYSLRLGSDFIGLYARFKSGSDPGQMYWKHKALEAKAQVIEGAGPIHLVLEPDGFLGMYQNGSVPVDIEAFNSYQQPGSGLRRVKLETDGNLKGYYWNGSNWTLDYQGISDPCELPSSCGSYGLCQPGKGCSCLANSTDHKSGQCLYSNNQNVGDFCNAYESKYKILRRNGVELPFKELMSYKTMESTEQCERACQENCKCWGVVYSNSSGFCYILDYPIQTLLKVGDETKVGYFKVKEGVGKGKSRVWLGVGLGLMCVVILVIVVFGLRWYRFRQRKKGVRRYVGGEDGELGVGPYKDLAATSSFRSIELSER